LRDLWLNLASLCLPVLQGIRSSSNPRVKPLGRLHAPFFSRKASQAKERPPPKAPAHLTGTRREKPGLNSTCKPKDLWLCVQEGSVRDRHRGRTDLPPNIPLRRGHRYMFSERLGRVNETYCRSSRHLQSPKCVPEDWVFVYVCSSREVVLGRKRFPGCASLDIE